MEFFASIFLFIISVDCIALTSIKSNTYVKSWSPGYSPWKIFDEFLRALNRRLPNLGSGRSVFAALALFQPSLACDKVQLILLNFWVLFFEENLDGLFNHFVGQLTLRLPSPTSRLSSGSTSSFQSRPVTLKGRGACKIFVFNA